MDDPEGFRAAHDSTFKSSLKLHDGAVLEFLDKASRKDSGGR
jgi:hypothetical protein